MPSTILRPLALGLSSSLLMLVQAAVAADGEAIIQKGGASPAATPCMSCHGADGRGMAAGGFPRTSTFHATISISRPGKLMPKIAA